MIEAKASGDKTYAKVAGTGRDTMKEYIMVTKRNVIEKRAGHLYGVRQRVSE